MGRGESIINAKRRCWKCGTEQGLHLHHIFGGANRPLSDEDGCWVYLCGPHHNLSRFGVHFDKMFDTELKELAQNEWERRYGTRDEFRRRYGKSYL